MQPPSNENAVVPLSGMATEPLSIRGPDGAIGLSQQSSSPASALSGPFACSRLFPLDMSEINTSRSVLPPGLFCFSQERLGHGDWALSAAAAAG